MSYTRCSTSHIAFTVTVAWCCHLVNANAGPNEGGVTSHPITIGPNEFSTDMRRLGAGELNSALILIGT